MRRSLILQTYRQILRVARDKKEWKPSYVNTKINYNLPGNVYIHCIWKDTHTGNEFYNMCEYPYNQPNSWVINFLHFTKTQIIKNKNTEENYNNLKYLLNVLENSLEMKKAILSTYSKKEFIFSIIKNDRLRSK